ncbi:MAG: hypothetical protein FJ216_03200 [Ignavibacteria bacterium]|nr:hypothetical protein [Ignavibacteria bacterium]
MKITRNKFIFYTGIILAGMCSIIKSPIKFLINPDNNEKNLSKNKMEIKFRPNPDAVRRKST